MFDDLQQLFGYQGAMDERTGVTELGPDLLTVPCWTREFCATVVRVAEALVACSTILVVVCLPEVLHERPMPADGAARVVVDHRHLFGDTHRLVAIGNRIAEDQQIGVLNGVVDPRLAVHAHHAHVQRVRGRKRAEPKEHDLW